MVAAIGEVVELIDVAMSGESGCRSRVALAVPTMRTADATVATACTLGTGAARASVTGATTSTAPRTDVTGSAPVTAFSVSSTTAVTGATMGLTGGTTGAPATPAILRYNGTAWAPQTSPVAQVLHSVEMNCSSGTATGVAVGDAGTILYYDGVNWTSRPGGAGTLMSVGRAGTGWYAAGLGGVAQRAQ